MARNHGDCREGYRARVRSEMPRRPDRECAFPEIAQQREEKTGLAQHPSDILCPDITTAGVANVLSHPHADQVIAGRKTTQSVRTQGNPARFRPVSRLKLFDPGHAVYFTSFRKPTILCACYFYDWPEFRQITRSVGTKKCCKK